MPSPDKVVGRALSLFHHPRVTRRDSASPESGASDADIAGFEQRTGIPVPPELRRWLHVCDGSLSGAYGTFGVAPSSPHREIEGYLTLDEAWLDLAWIPIAGDGTGD
jgi:cell wall assembly regulator SMI1